MRATEILTIKMWTIYLFWGVMLTLNISPMHQYAHVRFVGNIWSFLLPPYRPILFPQHTTYLPGNFEGSPYRPDLDHHVTTAKLLAISTRVAIYGVLCPGGLPCPCPGHIAHQWALTCRENQSHLRYLTASTRYRHGLVICEGAAKKRAVYLGRESVAFVCIHSPILSISSI